jgi:hypothetical protein
MAAADAAHHFGDMAIGAIERRAALGIVPGDRRQPPFDGAYRSRLAGDCLFGGAGREIEADDLRGRG